MDFRRGRALEGRGAYVVEMGNDLAITAHAGADAAVGVHDVTAGVDEDEIALAADGLEDEGDGAGAAGIGMLVGELEGEDALQRRLLDAGEAAALNVLAKEKQQG